MNKHVRSHTMRPETLFSEDGRAACVCLRVDRIGYEFARYFSQFNIDPELEGTAEEYLELYLWMVLEKFMEDAQWTAPEEIMALYRTAEDQEAGNPQKTFN